MEEGKRNILYIDDDEDEYIIVKFYFSKFSEKYNLIWFDSFKEGLNQIFDSKYELCLLDYRLGSFSGIDIIREARNKMKNTLDEINRLKKQKMEIASKLKATLEAHLNMVNSIMDKNDELIELRLNHNDLKSSLSKSLNEIDKEESIPEL